MSTPLPARYFQYKHLPERLQGFSQPFFETAAYLLGCNSGGLEKIKALHDVCEDALFPGMERAAREQVRIAIKFVQQAYKIYEPLQEFVDVNSGPFDNIQAKMKERKNAAVLDHTLWNLLCAKDALVRSQADTEMPLEFVVAGLVTFSVKRQKSEERDPKSFTARLNVFTEIGDIHVDDGKLDSSAIEKEDVKAWLAIDGVVEAIERYFRLLHPVDS